MILDCCITCAYTEFKEENFSHFDLLWNLFPDELVRRASGKDIIERSHEDEEKFKKSLGLMREQNNEKFQALKEMKDNKIACLECNKKIPDDLCIFKSDISEIKSKIPSTVKDYIAVRKVYYCYLVAYKRLYSMNKSVCIPCLDNSKQQITNHYISRISGLHNNQVKKAVDTLVDMKIIKSVSLRDISHVSYYLSLISRIRNRFIMMGRIILEHLSLWTGIWADKECKIAPKCTKVWFKKPWFYKEKHTKNLIIR